MARYRTAIRSNDILHLQVNCVTHGVDVAHVLVHVPFPVPVAIHHRARLLVTVLLDKGMYSDDLGCSCSTKLLWVGIGKGVWHDFDALKGVKVRRIAELAECGQFLRNSATSCLTLNARSDCLWRKPEEVFESWRLGIRICLLEENFEARHAFGWLVVDAYTVLRASVARAICAAGLHPSIGLRHHNRYDPFCLAADLMETFRPLIDRRVAQWIKHHPPSATLDADAKKWLIEAVTMRYWVNREERVLSDILFRVVNSLSAVLVGSQEKLDLPEPLEPCLVESISPPTGVCG